MELTGHALTGLFIGLVWVLIETVKFFIRKYGKTKDAAELESVAVNLANVQVAQFKEISDKISQVKESCFLTKEQVDILEEVREKIRKLDEMHSVFNENHVPAWYVPSELLTLVRESSTCLDNLEKSLDIAIDEIKAGQAVVVNRMSDLITSQKLMTERLGDLIAALNNKFSR